MDISSVTKAFQSERLIYRSPEDNDKDKEFFFKHIENDPVAKALADPSILRPRNMKGVENFLTEFQKSTLAVVLCLSPTEAKKQNIESDEPVPIGFICIGWGGTPKNREQHRATHIGIVIAEPFRNKGYGGESINWALDWSFRCALCGMDIPRSYYHGRPQVWWCKVFAVQGKDDQSDISLTPFGYREDGILETHPIFPPTQGFFMHQEILQVLFDFIQSMSRINDPKWVSYLLPENEQALYRSGSWPECEFYTADPSISVAHPITHRFVDGGTYGSQAAPDLFWKLSTELNHYIINLLDTDSFCNLRLASITVAKVSKPGDLPQTFWASRFSHNREMNFFPIEHDRTETWRDLYFDLKYSLRDRNITPCLISMLHQRPHLEDTARCEDELVSLGYEMTEKVQGFGSVWDMGFAVISPVANSIPVTGSRYLNLGIGEAAKISVYLDKRYYICGFRARRRDNSEMFRIGLIQPDAETDMVISPSEQVVAVKVAATSGGIVGLAFRIKDEIGGLSWKHVGRVDKPHEYVGIKMLKPKNGLCISGLLLGLDACKIVSIQLVEKRGENHSPRSDGLHVWHPAPPNPDVVTILPPTVDTEAQQPAFLLNMDFGGPNGSLLPLLNRITIFHDYKYSMVRGLGFHYTDGTKREFGFRAIMYATRERWWSVEQSISIDGPAGERITGLGFRSEQILDRHIAVESYSLKMTTNFGRVLKPTNFKNPPEDHLRVGPDMVSPRGEAITGFLAQVHMIEPLGTIRSLGLVHLKDQDVSLPNAPLPNLTDSKEGARSRVDSKDIYVADSYPLSTVRFDGIKRLGISKGKTGRSRLPDEVSGLCFEFWNATTPIYVGQWFEEIVHLDFGIGDRITSMTFEGDKGSRRHVHPYNRVGTGEFSGIRIERSGAGINAVEVHLGPQRDMHRFCYTENPFQKLDGLVWQTCNTSDVVDMVLKPFTLSQGRPFQKLLLFWRIQGKEGSWTNVSQISAFFDSGNERLCGLGFTYWDNQTQSAGCTRGAEATLSLNL
ncbi:hypothetical protein F52700_5915 [Fusarium sp. NRRL 52700]|nr:hypothetical protein F52700_5915 [Fusarium sp. NRRL 52700]